MSFYGPSSHLELTGNFGIVTALQKKLDDLLLARAKSDRVLFHQIPLIALML
jgi:hypothetical protein